MLGRYWRSFREAARSRIAELLHRRVNQAEKQDNREGKEGGNAPRLNPRRIVAAKNANPPKTTQSHTQQPKKKREIDPASKFWRGWWWAEHDPVARFTGWVSAFTFILMIIAALQAWAFFISERAELAPSAMVTYPNPLTPGATVSYGMTIKNGGKQVAIVNDLVSDISAPSAPLPDKPNYIHGAGNWPIAILPEQEVPMGGEVVDGNGRLAVVSNEDIAGLLNRKVNIWIYGYVSYRDAFSLLLGSKRMGFCFRYNPNGDLTKPASFQSCGNANYVYSRTTWP
jgi:hypothetical protein